ncbi:tetratricopeptide repeat-containing sensor histidine kinase [Marinirhabdus gelatinilytica]|uniref:tetratricopeptide repeat-containing sensor histidine kinase n=1 Tax=Marinirhabdus gelatinilytica TaxID=1703343 RepID=UPI000E0F525D|nr:tetratricopeptide repeat protein [Marinirhabdus gelatinilytica]
MKIKGSIYIFCTCLFLCNALTALGQRKPVNQRNVDSILQLVGTMDKDLQAIKLLTSQAGKNRYAAPTKRLIDNAVKISEEVNSPEMLANSYYSLGNFHFFNSQLDSASTYLNKSASFIEGKEFPFLRSGISATRGGIAKKQDAISQSIVYTMRAKEILDKIDTTTLTPELKKKRKGQNLVLSNSLANLYNKTEDYETSLIYYNLANEAALSMNDTYGAGVITSNKGNLLLKMGRHQDALEALKKGKELKTKAGAPLTSLGISSLNIGAAHLELGDVEKAMQNFNDAMAIFEEKKHAAGIAEVLPLRGTLFIKKGNLDLAIADCEKAKNLIDAIKVPELMTAACECLFDAYKRKGNFEKALENFEMFTVARDSVINEKNIKKLTQIEMQYDFNKKQEEQEAILQKEKQLKRNILIGLITLAVFSIVIILFLRKRMQYKNRLAVQTEALQQQKITELQQKNKLIAMNSMIEGQEAERLRIAKDLHDSLGGLLSTVKAHFTTIQNEINVLSELNLTEKTNQLIDEACIEVRRISHNMMPHALSISGLQGAIEDVGTHLKEQGYDVNIEITNLPKNIEPTKEVMIYRLIQEIISNIRKHANAKNILVQLVGHNQELNLLIEDDGKGFNIKKVKANGGLGLKSIHSRVAYLDGTIDWDSQPGNGTSVTINIPLL